MILGLGAGWQEREHRLFGHDLGDVPTRMARLAEGLEVITRLLHSNEPVTFEGRFFQLRDATLLPRPQCPGGPSILIGGNGFKRTLPLAARYATIWNGTFLTPNNFQQRSHVLDELLRAAGRKPEDVRRTMMLTLFFGRDMQELDRRLSWRHHQPELANKPLNAVIETLSAGGRALVGTPDMLVEQIHSYANVGVQELMLQWFDQDDIEGLQAFASSVLPHV
jgi:alkanesulfonate monooxygenase SsuD/methylene tetrahydromethanopterin reductase-like flavin-dependent oxidoreductase (luciferase family)